jgi:hypothetical protein
VSRVEIIGLDRWAHRLRWAYLIPVSSSLSLWYQVSRRWRKFPDFAGPDREGGEEPVNNIRAQAMPATIFTAVRWGTRWPPFRSTCLVRSLVLARLLRFYGHPATVVIGVPQEGLEDAGVWFAHAWVDMGKSVDASGYQELVRLAVRPEHGPKELR